MGALVELVSVFNLNASLNIRFSAGDPIEEMAALHREFKIFTSTHDLRSAAALLGLVPDTAREREEWLGSLDNLTPLESDDEGLKGHDRIRSALADNLGSRTPLPVYFRYHDGKRDARVVVSTGTPLIFLEVMHLIVSVPTLIAREAMRTAVKRAGPWSSRKSAQAPAPAAAKKAAAKPAKKSAKK